MSSQYYYYYSKNRHFLEMQLIPIAWAWKLCSVLGLFIYYVFITYFLFELFLV
jgi:hypothetical protein